MHSLLLLALPAFTTLASAAFDPLSKDNVITYWGQGANQERLIETCKNPNIDIINVGFVNVFPDQGPGGWPGTNFGNACWGDVYNVTTDVPSKLLQTCPYIGPDVIECQQTYGKKIFLSVGGAKPSDYYIKTDASAKKFANFLWQAFGPVSATKAGVPRPWGDAAVDGFDFDIESFISPAPQKNYLTSGYVAMINQLKNTLFPTDTSKSYYISGAPQCVIPDVHFTTVLQNAWFDFLFVQFYNSAGCSARDAVNKAAGKGTADISFANWNVAKSKNPNVRVSIGLPASDAASSLADYYLQPAEAMALVKRFYSSKLYGGIMLWEATYSKNNVICDTDYAGWMKKILKARAKGKNAVTTCKTSRRDLKRQAPAYSTCSAITTSTVTETGTITVTEYPSSTAYPASSALPVSSPAETVCSTTQVTVVETQTLTSTVYASDVVPASSGYPAVISSSAAPVTSAPPYPQSSVLPTVVTYSSGDLTYTSTQVVTIYPTPIGTATPTASAGYGGQSWGPVPATGGGSIQKAGFLGMAAFGGIAVFMI